MPPLSIHRKPDRIRTPLTKAGRAGVVTRCAAWSARHPVLSIVLVSLLAVVINCYPVIFCGKSFVSPTSVEQDIYSWWPPVPGMSSKLRPWNQHGSDTGALMWNAVPFSFVESRSLLDYGELPLWNRYSRAGDTLIGQATSMAGDPLHAIVLLGRGAAWAWDIKFLTAKFLFCVGFGLLVLRLFGSKPLALIYAALAAYCGVYFYLENHPALFVFSYTPWILLSAIEMLDLPSPRALRWGLVWLVANFGCFNAGQVEPAVLLIGGLNLAALANALIVQRHALDIVKVLGRMVVGTLLFLGLTAPWWLSFLAALKGSFSDHLEIRVLQLPLKVIPGLFDDFFYQMANSNIDAVGPGTSMLVLVGCILSFFRWWQLKTEPFFWVNLGAIVLWSGCVFGWVPGSLLAKIPFLNLVGHTYRDFSYLLVIHLTLQSAYGFRCLADSGAFEKALQDLAWVTGILLAVVLGYLFLIPNVDMQWLYFLEVTVAAVLAPLLFTFLKSPDPHKHRLNEWLLLAGWVGIIILGFIPQQRFAFYTFGNQTLFMLPGPRVELDAPSPAINTIKADLSGPFRITGLQGSFIGDCPAIYGLEDIRSCAPISNGEFINLISNFPGVKLLPGGWQFNVLDPVQAHPLLNLLNVKYLLANPLTAINGPIDYLIADRSDFLVLENPHTWPRAFFSSQVVPISSNEVFIEYLLANGNQPFIAMATDEIAKQPGLEQLESAKPAAITPATNYQLLPNSTSFDIHASSAGVVCLTEEQARDFRATVNNEDKEVLTVNRAFKGIYLDQPGDYHIEFTFRPHHWQLACSLFWISVAGIFSTLR